jgi:hypothetical protein
VLRVRGRLEDARRQGILLAVPVLEQREQGVDLWQLDLRTGLCNGRGGSVGLFGILERRRHGGHAIGCCAALDCACEGAVRAEEVLGPEGQDARVVLYYGLWGSEGIRRCVAALGRNTDGLRHGGCGCGIVRPLSAAGYARIICDVR